jgi:hypothetical protein
LSDCAIVTDAAGAEGRSNVSGSRRRTHAPDPQRLVNILKSGRSVDRAVAAGNDVQEAPTGWVQLLECLVGTYADRIRDLDADCSRGFQVDRHTGGADLLHRDTRGTFAQQDPLYELGGAPKAADTINPV